MTKSEFVGFRATPAEREKIERIAKAASLTTSEVIRRLVASADLQPVQRYEPVLSVASREAAAQ
jgi:hypothetical protein